MGRLGARRGDPHHCRGSPLKEHIRSRFGNRMQRCLSEASAWVDIIQCRLASVRRNRSDQAVNSDRMYRQVREDLLGRSTLGRAAHNSTQMLASFVMPMRVWCSNERGVHRHFARSRKTPQSFTIMCHTFHDYFLAVNFPPSNVCYAV